MAHGRSPGLRVDALCRLPGPAGPVACGRRSPLTVAGAAPALGPDVGRPLRIPIFAFRTLCAAWKDHAHHPYRRGPSAVKTNCGARASEHDATCRRCRFGTGANGQCGFLSDAPQTVWVKGDVSVTAIGSMHVPGHASYRVDTPAGSVVIGGDAGNDARKPPRDTSTWAQVETLAEGADILVHSVIYPVMGPDGTSGFRPPIYYRQSTATDLGSLAQSAGVGHLMLTHLIPPLGAPRQGPYPIEGGGLTEADYVDAVRAGGFERGVTVGADLVSHRLVAE